MEEHLETFTNTTNTFSDDIDSAVSTPYASAPSSPGRTAPHYSNTNDGGGGGFFYSAPASPMHHILSSSSLCSVSSTNLETGGGSFEFELTAGPPPSGSMSSADELFLNGQIRPMKLSSHLKHPQDLLPGQNDDVLASNNDEEISKYRDYKSRDRRRRARSMSPLRSSNTAFQWLEGFKDGRDSTEINEIKLKLDSEDEKKYLETETEASSGASSRSSSAGRSSKRWVFLKEFLHRSKSEGSNSNNKSHKFWSTLSLRRSSTNVKSEEISVPKVAAKKAVNGVNRKLRRSAHEVHYTMNRAQAEEMRRKTYLPYRQGLLGCLGFSSKGYGAMNGFARAFNPVSSR